MRAALYARVSTEDQAREGTSLETQERACAEYAKAAGWEVVGRFRDSSSGFSLDRDGLDGLRSLIRGSQVDCVVAYAVDRLSRNQNQIGVLFDEANQNSVKLDFVTERFEDTAVGRFIMAARAFVAEVEREKIVERTSRGKAERARSGKLPQAAGRGIYGYSYDRETGRRSVVPEQASVVSRLFEGFASGQSIIGMANSLNEEGIRTLHGKSWSNATIFHMLRNPCYSGRTTFRRLKTSFVRNPLTGKKKRKVAVRDEDEWIDVPDATPAIVSQEVFEAVQARLDDPERLRLGRRKATYGLVGRIKCRHCGASMVGQTLKGEYRYYRCRRAFAGPKHDRCNSFYVRANDLETDLLSEIGRTLACPEIVVNELVRVRNRQLVVNDDSDTRRRIAAIDQQRERLLKLYQLGEVDDEYLATESARLKAENHRLSSLLAKEPEAAIQWPNEAEIPEFCERVRKWFEDRGPAELPLIGQALQLTVFASKDGSEVKGVIPAYAPQDEHAYVRAMVT